MMKLKKNTTVEQMCEGLHPRMQDYMFYVRSLKWDEKPNYKQIYKLFSKCLKNAGKEPIQFDWVTYKARVIEDRAIAKILYEIESKTANLQ